MKAIAISGITMSGKTTVCETIISGLRKRGYSVGSVKEIHYEDFKIDPEPSSNTYRHREAGSQLVCARGMYETDILYPSKLPIGEVLKHYDHDFVILEGVSDCNVPRIITAHSEQEVEERMDERTVLVSGVIANSGITQVHGLPVINALKAPEELVDFVVRHAFEPLPSFDPKCCSACGHTCRELAGLIAHGKSKRKDCVLTSQKIDLLIDGQPVQMVPFVQNVLQNAVMGVIKELSGFSSGSDIEVKFRS
jgi:molybdopterin-guanine dinucleotide biosynthesis protein B